MEYYDLSIRIQGNGDILVESKLEGQSRGRVNLQKSEIDPDIQLIDKWDVEDKEILKDIGRKLYNSLFNAKISEHYGAIKGRAKLEGRGVRLRLNFFDKPEMATIPWEFLYDDSTNTFLSNDARIALSRYIDLPLGAQEIKPTTPPLKILLIISSPKNLAPLRSDDTGENDEEKIIREALKDLIKSGDIEIDPLKDATIAKIAKTIEMKSYHVIHFIGHGDFENNIGKIALVNDDDGRSEWLDDEEFA
ncbi:MAG: CHAT domain-containing protein, partial [Methanoregulaceae archaeon]|nr:CHAT domain-containing protein [Methanoregulaceae archaeon]